jgi:hypothetical protein
MFIIVLRIRLVLMVLVVQIQLARFQVMDVLILAQQSKNSTGATD